jgi:hypothetical protein
VTHPRSSIFGSMLLAAALFAPAARSQSYGPDFQVLTIGAAEFRSLSTFSPYVASDGYVYSTGVHDYLAPLSLPEGALIGMVCLYVNDSDPGASVQAGLKAVKLVPGGEGPRSATLNVFAVSSSDSGYGRYCADPPFYTLRGRIDFDGDGTLDAAAYYVWVYASTVTQGSLGFGGVQITWKRQASGAPSAPTFGDVPPTDHAFRFIEALAASGITAGCAGGNFCPDANLTRRQMAVFLARALGLHWAD